MFRKKVCSWDLNLGTFVYAEDFRAVVSEVGSTVPWGPMGLPRGL
jgi:hypothetical protein